LGSLLIDLVDSRTQKVLRRNFATRPILQNAQADVRQAPDYAPRLWDNSLFGRAGPYCTKGQWLGSSGSRYDRHGFYS
jgi:hypothetical protein